MIDLLYSLNDFEKKKKFVADLYVSLFMYLLLLLFVFCLFA